MIKVTTAEPEKKTYECVGFDVTGLTVDGQRFKLSYPGDRPGFMTANGINLWRGSLWGRLATGKRVLLKRVFN